MNARTRREHQKTLIPRPNRLILLGMKSPRILYHLKLGWLLGHRILLLTHQGRKSGLIHQTPLEVVRWDAATKTAIVISAWGETSDWYRNIRQAPALQIEIGRDRFVPDQRFPALDETLHEIEIYVKDHNLNAKMLSRLFKIDFANDPDARHKLATSTRMVAFQPHEKSLN